MSGSLYNWLDQRYAGVLLHPTAFPSDQGIGSLGKQARRFIDFLKASSMQFWQVCPLGPTGFGDSPYQSFSAFAGNPYLIDLHQLVSCGLLKDADLVALQVLDEEKVDYGEVYKRFWPILQTAYDRYAKLKTKPVELSDFEQFKKDKEEWLAPYSAFMALKLKNKGKCWLEWPKKDRSYADALKNGELKDVQEEIERQQFYQYVFFKHWNALRKFANGKGISIMGDVPIFVALDSAEVWANQELFQLKKDGSPKAVAGVPPDYFSETGQLWGNPLFDWSAMKKDGYQWWIRRMEAMQELYDVVRIDHFRGFEAYWSVPAGDQDATGGKWEKGPGLDFFKALHKASPDMKLVAEDLGVITDEVRKLLADTGLPGMSVLHFAFGGGADNLYLPHNVSKNTVIYPGSHDNDTTLGWYAKADESTRHHVRQYLRISGQEVNWDFIRTAYSSTANLAVIPLQDLMNLGSEARFNTPGTSMGNWQWRYSQKQLDEVWRQSSGYLCDLANLYGRESSPD